MKCVRYTLLRALFAHVSFELLDKEDFAVRITVFDDIMRWIGPFDDDFIEDVRVQQPW